MSTGEDRILPRPHSPNRILAVVVGALLLIAVIIVVLSASKSAVVFDRKTPAGVVQAYLKAAFDGKSDEAAKYLAPGSLCEVQDLDRAYVVKTVRVDLVDSTIDGKNARVRIIVDMPAAGPFENFATEDHTLRLIFSGGQWWLTGIPWPLYACAGQVNK